MLHRFLLVGLFCLFAFPTLAAPDTIVCDSRESIVSRLQEDYKETRTSIGLANSGKVVEVFSSTSGTWSMLITRPDGISCLIAAGQNWESLAKKVGTGT